MQINGLRVVRADYLANMTLMGWQFGVPDIDGVYWSLVVEIKFYVIVAVVLACGQMKRVRLLLFGVWS